MASHTMKLMAAALLLLALGAAAAFQTGPCQGMPRCKCKWSEGKRMADCANSGFTRVPKDLSDDIQTLILDGNPLGALDKDIFKSVGLLNLRILSLRSCGLEYVDDNAFRDLKIMTSLDLSRNNVTKIFPKTFDGNDNLKTIRLSHNPITGLEYYQGRNKSPNFETVYFQTYREIAIIQWERFSSKRNAFCDNFASTQLTLGEQFIYWQRINVFLLN
jgi:hypothetical protein